MSDRREAAARSPGAANSGTPPGPAADRERVILLECRLEQMRSALGAAREEADAARTKLAESCAREADHARRFGEIHAELADARAEVAALHRRLERSEALKSEIEGYLFESGAQADTEELARLRTRVLVEDQRALVNDRTLARLRWRVEDLAATRETLLTRVAEWQQLIRNEGPDAADLSEFLAELRREILELEHRNVTSDAREMLLRERLARAGIDPDEDSGADISPAPDGADRPAPKGEPDAARPIEEPNAVPAEVRAEGNAPEEPDVTHVPAGPDTTAAAGPAEAHPTPAARERLEEPVQAVTSDVREVPDDGAATSVEVVAASAAVASEPAAQPEPAVEPEQDAAPRTVLEPEQDAAPRTVLDPEPAAAARTAQAAEPDQPIEPVRSIEPAASDRPESVRASLPPARAAGPRVPEPAQPRSRTDTLIADLMETESSARRADLLLQLGRSGDARAHNMIRPWTESLEASVRAAAYEALGRLLERAPDRLEPHLRTGLSDPDARVRRRVALAAATARGLTPRRLLEPLKEDPDPQVRRVVREVLRQAPRAGQEPESRREEVPAADDEAPAHPPGHRANGNSSSVSNRSLRAR